VVLLLATPASAETFCDRLGAIINTAPGFEKLRGTPSGDDFIATTTIAAAPRCMVVHPPGGGPDTLGSEWSFRCDWPHVAPEAIDWFKQQVGRCYPSSAEMFQDLATLGASSKIGGFMWQLGGFTIIFMFDRETQAGQFSVQGQPRV
jgi:hypothetical protein